MASLDLRAPTSDPVSPNVAHCDVPVVELRGTRATSNRPRRRRASLYRRSKWRSRRRTAYGFLLAAIVGAMSYFWPAVQVALNGTDHKVDTVLSAKGNSVPESAALAPVAAPPGQPFTVLLLGSDNDSKFVGDHALTQSMILVRVNPGTDRVTMLSIPRDLYVPLSTGGTDKIDKAYLYGHADAAVQTVERDLHIHVDHYVWIGLQGLVNLINMVGGVDINATHPVLDDYYPADQTSQNPYDYDRIAVMPGPQHLDGLHAMEYVRSRHDDALSDIGRSQRQQQVLTSLRDKLNGIGLSDIPRLAQAMQGQFGTDISLTDLGYLSSMLSLSHKVNPNNIQHIVLLQQYWSSGYIGGQDVLIPKWPAILALVHQIFPATKS